MLKTALVSGSYLKHFREIIAEKSNRLNEAAVDATTNKLKE